jgi:hypothetical protein
MTVELVDGRCPIPWIPAYAGMTESLILMTGLVLIRHAHPVYRLWMNFELRNLSYKLQVVKTRP